MVNYYVVTNNKRKYIETIDYANTTLTWTTNREKAYNSRGGYYAEPTRDLISRGFAEKYPEVVNLQYESSDY